VITAIISHACIYPLFLDRSLVLIGLQFVGTTQVAALKWNSKFSNFLQASYRAARQSVLPYLYVER